MSVHPLEAMGLPDPEEVEALRQRDIKLWGKIDKLVHRVFEQNEHGRELLTIWREALIMAPTVTPNSTQFQAGIEEGKKEFIRNIHLTIKHIEEEQKNDG